MHTHKYYVSHVTPKKKALLNLNQEIDKFGDNMCRFSGINKEQQ